jgi:nucleotide-binding universal stress UspA family protein
MVVGAPSAGVGRTAGSVRVMVEAQATTEELPAMSFKIVVGINGAEGGADALALARRLAPPAAELIGVAVAVLAAHPSRAANADYDAIVRADAAAIVETARTANPDLLGEVPDAGSVAAGLHRAAERLDADLVVIGSCRRGLMGRILSGDDVRETLRDAQRPVAVAPRGFALADAPVQTIGLGWDRGSEANEALGFARTLATGLHAQLHALNVVALPPWPVIEGTTTQMEVDAAVQEAEDLLAGLEAVETSTVTGEAADELKIFAAEVDVLVVGSHQRGSIGRIAMGSTSESLARDCARPLVVVPRAEQPAGSAA